jgi:hypothetical protein
VSDQLQASPALPCERLLVPTECVDFFRGWNSIQKLILVTKMRVHLQVAMPAGKFSQNLVRIDDVK